MGRKLDIDALVASLEQTDEDRVYFRVGLFDILVVHTDEGVVVDIFPYNEDSLANNSLATTYAFDSEAIPEEED